MVFSIGQKQIGGEAPVYFIADIAASHDGDLNRAKDLINLAKEAGADAAKFQNFKASKIISPAGFEKMQGKLSHQANWSKSVYEVYEDASVPDDWSAVLKAECDAIGIEYMTTPYDLDAVDLVDQYVNAYKIGSGDIDWLELLAYVATKRKPMILSTGAATMHDVEVAMDVLLESVKDIVLMQCNTNYTGSTECFKHINLNVLKSYAEKFPSAVLGLSDHTPGHSTVLGAIALGAKVIEKHFTDDNSREGPDHAFSMTPKTWADMVYSSRELEQALGDGVKVVEKNELDTAVIQRRALRAACNISAGDIITRDMIDVLRPANAVTCRPVVLKDIVGKAARRNIQKSADFLVEDTL